MQIYNFYALVGSFNTVPRNNLCCLARHLNQQYPLGVSLVFAARDGLLNSHKQSLGLCTRGDLTAPCPPYRPG